MFWKILLGLGILGLVISVCMVIIFVKMFYGAGFQSNDEDLAFGGLLVGVILLIISFLVTIVSVIFVMRNSKKEWDAKNLK
jgi:NADH:ubiquinone oxidoreductase subunit 6 (subunit J)